MPKIPKVNVSICLDSGEEVHLTEDISFRVRATFSEASGGGYNQKWDFDDYVEADAMRKKCNEYSNCEMVAIEVLRCIGTIGTL